MESNQPALIQQLSAPQLQDMIERRVPFELVDVRTEGERAIAKIDRARLLDKPYHDYLLGLDRSTAIVFQCHHGIRSQSAAAYFAEHGFRCLYNLTGGIDAWSQLVDGSVPRY